MASIIPGYNYDIFISYRQKDNKGDTWVSEFVDALKDELESTFKEDVSVYFDINPHDGLLETHDVDESLKEKLKCLVFIPIISLTYCDPKSFAWEHEFTVFVEQASQDHFGLKVKLPGGNVASRVLPVQIYNLDNEDIILCESVLEGVLRAIEFIYKEPGVNRPLSPEDDTKENLNKTKYRNQVNKVANAIKEIISGLKNYDQNSVAVSKEIIKARPVSPKNLNPKILITSVITLTMIVLGLFIIPKLFKSSEPLENSIAVLPFVIDSPDEANSLFVNSFPEEIRNKLQQIENLRVIDRKSSEYYNSQHLSSAEIAKNLGVNYLVQGSGFKMGDIFRITVTLTLPSKGITLWSQPYEKETKDLKELFAIYLQIAEAIATKLRAVITPEEKQLIEKAPTADMAAYDAYLRGQSYFYNWDLSSESLDSAMHYFNLAKYIDPEYALAYAGISDVWTMRQQGFHTSIDVAKDSTMAAIQKALIRDNNSAEVYYSLAFMNQFLFWDWKGSESAYQRAIQINPNHAMAHAFYSNLLSAQGRHKEAIEQIKIALELDPKNPLPKALYGISLMFISRYDDAIKTFQDAMKIDSNQYIAKWNNPLAFHMAGMYDEALELFKSYYIDFYKDFAHAFDQGDEKADYIDILTLEADTLVTQYKPYSIWPSDIYFLYIFVGNKERALEWMERGYEAHENMNIYLLFPPIYDFMHNEPRYQELCTKMNLPYK
jgi:TolB-like protein